MVRRLAARVALGPGAPSSCARRPRDTSHRRRHSESTDGCARSPSPCSSRLREPSVVRKATHTRARERSIHRGVVRHRGQQRRAAGRTVLAATPSRSRTPRPRWASACARCGERPRTTSGSSARRRSPSSTTTRASFGARTSGPMAESSSTRRSPSIASEHPVAPANSWDVEHQPLGRWSEPCISQDDSLNVRFRALLAVSSLAVGSVTTCRRAARASRRSRALRPARRLRPRASAAPMHPPSPTQRAVDAAPPLSDAAKSDAGPLPVVCASVPCATSLVTTLAMQALRCSARDFAPCSTTAR